MSTNRLKHRQQKIQDKRKQTPWREFVMELGSWMSLVFYNNNGISRFPVSERVTSVVDVADFDENPQVGDYQGNFFSDFARFFQQSDFSRVVHHTPNENADYSDITLSSKDCYLSNTVIVDCSSVLYSFTVKENSHDVIGSSMVWNDSRIIYSSRGVINSMNIFYSSFVIDSHNLWFCANMTGCSECLFSANLSNKQYCINNKQYDKEEYFVKKQQLLSQKERFPDWFSRVSSTGNNTGTNLAHCSFVRDSHDVTNAMMSYQIKDGHNVAFWGGKNENESMYDVCNGGTVGNDNFYGVMGGGAGSNHVYLSCHVKGSYIYYSYLMTNCSYCFGCIGLHNKNYCIFNKPYTKEERYNKVDEIFTQMETDGTLGQFFPGSMNPFYFNDTAAYLIDDSFTKEEVTAKGYLWRDEPIAVDVPEWMDVVEVRDLDQYEGHDDTGNWMIDPSILKKVIRDEQGNVYRVIKMEYDFLMKYGLPLPRKHWLERLKEHFSVQ